MKKHINSSVVAIVLILVSFSKAQGIAIGELVPDVKIPFIINYPETSITLSDLKGKAVILDFWATWCGPCVEAFPKMDSLQKKFGDKLKILLVNNQKENVAMDFLKKIDKVKNIRLPTVLQDTQLNALFRHQVIPHYVWIDSDGIVQAITGADQVTEQNIASFIKGAKLALKTKNDSKINTNFFKPVFLRNPQVPFSEQDILYCSAPTDNYESILTKYNPMVHGYSNSNKYTDSTDARIVSINAPIIWLYMYAYGKGEWEMLNVEKIKTEIKDSAKYIFSWNENDNPDGFENYLGAHTFCYELIVRPSDSSNIFKIMQKDLEAYFDLRGSIERLPKTTWSLIRSDTTDRLQSKGGEAMELANAYGLRYKNRPFRYLLFDMDNIQSKYPIVNETGFDLEKRIDLDIVADLTNLNQVNSELAKYGLRFIEKEIEKDVIVIREVAK